MHLINWSIDVEGTALSVATDTRLLMEVHLSQIELALEVFNLFENRPAGLLSDIDGTLSRISNDPIAATVDPQIRISLTEIVNRIDVVGVVTGRSAAEAARMVNLDGVICLGNHGMEQISNGEVVVAQGASDYVQPMKRVLDEARLKIHDPLIYFENKGVTGSIHYRNASRPSLARDQILDVVSPLVAREELRLSHGRMVIELRPPIDLNKGTALESVVDEFELRSTLFMGDDVTDLDAMRAVKRLRDENRIVGLSIGVVGPETPPAVAQESDRLVRGVDGVSEFLARLADLYSRQ